MTEVKSDCSGNNNAAVKCIKLRSAIEEFLHSVNNNTPKETTQKIQDPQQNLEPNEIKVKEIEKVSKLESKLEKKRNKVFISLPNYKI